MTYFLPFESVTSTPPFNPNAFFKSSIPSSNLGSTLSKTSLFISTTGNL